MQVRLNVAGAVCWHNNNSIDMTSQGEQVYMRRSGSPGTPLKVHKRENFLGFDFEICTFSQLVMHKC